VQEIRPEGRDDMSTSLAIEEETGTYHGRREHAHNGYYAGDFSGQPFAPLPAVALIPVRTHLSTAFGAGL
jgi:hypothetical protein